jgi:HPr kinase/phosphorylase
MDNYKGVPLGELAEDLDLKLLNDVDYNQKIISKQDINRPGIQLTGYFEHYDSDRIQIIGFVESEFMCSLDREKKESIYNEFMREDIPGIIFCRGLIPDNLFLEKASQKNVPVFSSDVITTRFMSEIIRWLNVKLAPCITIHGCLADVYGVGVFIQGESGIGKSEALLELIKRGHRLIADDAVEIRKVSDETLYGQAPEMIRDFMEIRGIGIVDMRALYGYQIIKESQNIDLVITLEEWSKDKVYDRMGLDEKTTEILGNKVTHYEIPIRPGRNLAVIIEAAAVICRQRKLGYNSVEAFLQRQQSIKNR